MNPYGVDTRDDNLLGPLASLKILYKEMPETSGCERCAEVNGEDGKDWCCKRQSPSMYYVEFLKVYTNVVSNWNNEERFNLILRAVRNYLSNAANKGCIFYKDKCTCYEDRPLACREYGIIPSETWEKRWDLLKEQQGDQFDAIPQCSLVSSDRGVTVKDEERWFKHAQKCEERIGVPKSSIQQHDGSGGSYRTFHDHLLLDVLNADLLSRLSQLRISNPSDQEIEHIIISLRDFLIDSPD